VVILHIKSENGRGLVILFTNPVKDLMEITRN
jgi:hypothetical protein